MPDEVVQAWIHLLMALVRYDSDRRKAYRLLEDAHDLLDAGLKQMVMALSDRTLLSQAVVLPMELVSLLSLQLMQNPNPGLPDMMETYLSYITSIVSSPSLSLSDESGVLTHPRITTSAPGPQTAPTSATSPSSSKRSP